MKTNKTTVSIRLNENIIEKVDVYAEELGLTRTGAISSILALYFKSEENMKVLENITTLVRKEETLENV